MIQLCNLAVGYPRKTILEDVNARALPGTLTVLVGANGSGKSTLLRTLAGLATPLRGLVTVDGVQPANISIGRRARLISMVTTKTDAGGLTVTQTVAVGRQPYVGWGGSLAKNDRSAISSALEAVGITALADRPMGALSDGERQKAMIARALAQETPMMLLDEPTAFLDIASRLEVLGLLRRLADTYRRTIILSTHDIAPALRHADQAWTIADGTLTSCAPDDARTLSRAFAHRGITFDPTRGDFVLNTNQYKI